MVQKPEEYYEMLKALVKKELDLYTRYRLQDKGEGGLSAYKLERKLLFQEWDSFHETAYQSIKQGTMIPFEYLLRRLGLTEFEKHCACLAAAPELDRDFERLYAGIQQDRQFKYPTLDLCIRMFAPEPLEQERLLCQAVRRKELFQCVFQAKQGAVESELSWKLKLRSDLIEYLFFYESDLLNRKAYYTFGIPEGTESPGLNVNQKVQKELAGRLEREPEGMTQLLVLTGAAGIGKKLQVGLASKEKNRAVLYFDLENIRQKDPGQKRECILEAALRAVLNQANLCFCHWEALKSGEHWDMALIHYIIKYTGLFFSTLFLTAESDREWTESLSFYPLAESFHLKPPAIWQRVLLWKEFLAEQNPGERNLCERLAAQFDFMPGMIREVVEEAGKKADKKNGKIETAYLYEACHQKISHRLGERASRVNASYGWEELVLEDEAKGLLRQACSQISYRYLVYEEWGFLKRLPYGRGVSMLFAGPPGTGKTMAAQVMAKELNLELYKVDLSGVLSKYIGETQKNLRDIFDEVQKSRSILFFDEADALFGKRVNVSDSRDISANAQTAYLLQKIEEYDGITILATNLLQNFDDAYRRRMKYIISFTFPGTGQRRKLWEQVFPEEMPLADDIDIEYLASNFELSGAGIKNIALNAAFIAAGEQETAGMKHIMAALRQEYKKSGKTLGREELKEYYIYK